MKLASLKRGGRDGILAVVSRDLRTAVEVPDIARTMREAIEDWVRSVPALRAVYDALNRGEAASLRPFDLDPSSLHAPLPRAFQWFDGSAYLTHMERSRGARGAKLPQNYNTDPILYQSGSDRFLAPTENIVLPDPSWGLDVEGTLAVVTDDVPCGESAERAAEHVKLLLLANDLTLRNLLPLEFAKGVGFVWTKPARPFAPIAVTPDEFDSDWQDGRLRTDLKCWINDALIGDLDTGADMSFSFADLIAHAARTRSLAAGTIIGSGTISNRDPARGVACLAEKRAIEILERGSASTRYLEPGDRIRMEAFDGSGRSVFGAMEARVAG
jgi:fumarylacetoacetate (FAA) hydrolase